MTSPSIIKTHRKLLAAFAAVVASSSLASGAYATSLNVGSRTLDKLCPTHVGGDREFDGNGPFVSQYVGLKKDGSGRFAFLDFYFNWRETKSNFTEARYDQDYFIGNSPIGKRFTHVWAPDQNGTFGWRPWTTTYFDAYADDYTDTDVAVDVFYPSALPDTTVDRAWWIDKIEIQGDTKGNDVGACTTDDAYLSVFLPAIWLWY